MIGLGFKLYWFSSRWVRLFVTDGNKRAVPEMGLLKNINIPVQTDLITGSCLHKRLVSC